MTENNMKLIGITYPNFLSKFYYLWRKFLCKRGFHLFDEALSNYSGQMVRHLYCDACGLEVEIGQIFICPNCKKQEEYTSFSELVGAQPYCEECNEK
jgi:predicted RNA-binding Zn-ribbon protein involved in translation (DUF1610 family)